MSGDYVIKPGGFHGCSAGGFVKCLYFHDFAKGLWLDSKGA